MITLEALAPLKVLAVWLLWRWFWYRIELRAWRKNVHKWYSKPRATVCPYKKPIF